MRTHQTLASGLEWCVAACMPLMQMNIHVIHQSKNPQTPLWVGRQAVAYKLYHLTNVLCPLLLFFMKANILLLILRTRYDVCSFSALRKQ